jgi:hypothetical protein
MKKSTLMKRKFKFKIIAMAFLGFAASAFGVYLIAADHIDAPAVTGTGSDITDFYAFQSPSDANNIVFVANVQGLLSPAATSGASFDEEVMIEFNIDNSSTKDNMEDLVIQATFENGKVSVYGPVVPIQKGTASTLVSTASFVEAAITPYGNSPVIGEKNGIKIFAGPRDDPFFFDLTAYQAVIGGTASSFNDPGTDTFAGTNVLSLVVEVPKSMLGSANQVNTWVTANRKM